MTIAGWVALVVALLARVGGGAGVRLRARAARLDRELLALRARLAALRGGDRGGGAGRGRRALDRHRRTPSP